MHITARTGTEGYRSQTQKQKQTKKQTNKQKLLGRDIEMLVVQVWPECTEMLSQNNEREGIISVYYSYILSESFQILLYFFTLFIFTFYLL